jgi:dihydrofolate reductase
VIVSLIVAMDLRRGIGADSRLPWRLPADLKRFRELTLGHHLIVGRKTYESIGRPLPGRTMIIVTRDESYAAPDCLVAHTVEDALELARARGETEAMVGGGAEIYAQTLARADRIYLTLVHAEVAADTYFPALDESQWNEAAAEHHAADGKNPYPMTFKVLVRAAPPAG